MVLTRKQTQEVIDHIRRELESLEKFARNVGNSGGQTSAAMVGGIVLSRTSAIEKQLKWLEERI